MGDSTSGFDCWVCGATTGPQPPVDVIVAWLCEHEHTPVERAAARIVKAAERKYQRGRQRGN